MVSRSGWALSGFNFSLFGASRWDHFFPTITSPLKLQKSSTNYASEACSARAQEDPQEEPQEEPQEVGPRRRAKKS